MKTKKKMYIEKFSDASELGGVSSMFCRGQIAQETQTSVVFLGGNEAVFGDQKSD
jgi:hypothetical protein